MASASAAAHSHKYSVHGLDELVGAAAEEQAAVDRRLDAVPGAVPAAARVELEGLGAWVLDARGLYWTA